MPHEVRHEKESPVEHPDKNRASLLAQIVRHVVHQVEYRRLDPLFGDIHLERLVVEGYIGDHLSSVHLLSILVKYGSFDRQKEIVLPPALQHQVAAAQQIPGRNHALGAHLLLVDRKGVFLRARRASESEGRNPALTTSEATSIP